MGKLPKNFFQGSSEKIAKKLLGQIISRRLGQVTLMGRIVETEAYHQSDAASHTYVGQTERNQVMFQKAGYLYVYLSYGIHHCMNVVVGKEGEGAAVLIRALEPLAGHKKMQSLRAKSSRKKSFQNTELASGPGKACAALAIDLKQNGAYLLDNGPVQLLAGDVIAAKDICTRTRIGISKAVEKPWRFYIKNNPHISKK